MQADAYICIWNRFTYMDNLSTPLLLFAFVFKLYETMYFINLHGYVFMSTK